MRKIWQLVATITVLAMAAMGCGVADDDFEAGNRLKILGITDRDDSTAPIFFAVEETDDTGADGQPNTNDNGEGNGRPDDGETVVTRLSSDIGVIRLQNEARLGVDPGVDLRVFRVDVTYLDANGFSQTFAPTTTQRLDVAVPTDSEGSLEFVLVPIEMKVTPGGLRDIFLFGSDAERAAVQRMTATVDVYARDDLNNDTVHVQGSVTLTFINPIVFEIAE